MFNYIKKLISDFVLLLTSLTINRLCCYTYV